MSSNIHRDNGVGAVARLLIATAVATTLVGVTLASVLAAPIDDLSAAKAATARFNSVTQADRGGYGLPPGGPLHECIAAFDGTGAMGFHLINARLLDGGIDAAGPEALVYAHGSSGKVKLGARDYVIFPGC